MNRKNLIHQVSGKVVGGGVLGLAALVGVGALAFPGNADQTGQDPALTKREEASTELVTVDEDPEGPEDDTDAGAAAASQVTRSQSSRAAADSRQTRASAPSRQTRASAVSRASAPTRASAVSRASAQSRASAPSRDTVSRDTASRDTVSRDTVSRDTASRG